MDYSTIGKKIIMARKELNISQSDLAEKANSIIKTCKDKNPNDAISTLDLIGQTGISALEKGKVRIDSFRLKAIAEVLHKDISYFFSEGDINIHGIIEIPIYRDIPANFPTVSPQDVIGTFRCPSSIVQNDVSFALSNPTNLAMEPDESGELYLLKAETTPQDGKSMLLKINNLFYIARVSYKNNIFEVHFLFARKTMKPAQYTCLGSVVYVLSKSHS